MGSNKEYLEQCRVYEKKAKAYEKLLKAYEEQGKKEDYLKAADRYKEWLRKVQDKDYRGNEAIVSIVVLNYKHPEVITRLLRSFPLSTSVVSVPYELVVVDNGSDAETVKILQEFVRGENHTDQYSSCHRKIDTLVLNPTNEFFSGGNNTGVANTLPSTEYILLLNSDVEILHPEWLSRLVEWANGIPKTYQAHSCTTHPTVPGLGPRDIVTYGWSYSTNVPGNARPEGWCCLIRKKWWRNISTDFPFYHGFEEMIAQAIRDGAKAGVLFNYSRYVRHYECGSEGHLHQEEMVNKRAPNEHKWFSGVTPPKTLDFTLGPNEHRSYMEW